jgi:hypothetical protein
MVRLMINWKGYGNILRYYPGVCIEEQRRNTMKRKLYVNIKVVQMEDFVVKLSHALVFVTIASFRTPFLYAVGPQHGMTH